MSPDPEVNGPSFEEFLEFMDKAKGYAEVDFVEEERDLWNSWVDEVPWWRWAALWCERRVAVLEACLLGYQYDHREIQAEVERWKGTGKVLLSTSEDGLRRIYDYPDGTFLAYERAPEVTNEATGYKAHPWCWKRLEERPNVHLVEGVGEETVSTAAARKGDAETARLFAGVEDEVFGREIDVKKPEPPRAPMPLCVECFDEIKPGDGVVVGLDAAHRSCVEPPSPDRIADDLKESAAIPTTDGRRESANAPDPQAEIETSPAGSEPRVKVCCTTDGCTTNMVMPQSNWGRHSRACSVCGGPLMAWSVLAGKPNQTADLLEGRVKDGPWLCELCEKPAWTHVNYQAGSPLSHAGCPDFVIPSPTNGSICKACLYVHAWDVSAPAVVNVCDSCRAEKKLVPYKGRAHLEQLREKHAKKSDDSPPTTGKDCEGCGDPAEIQFARKGKGYPIIYACQSCSVKPEVRGRRKATMEI